jgi:archaellum component FlaC
MLKPFVEYILDLLNTARDTRTNKEAIADLREEVNQLATAVERISFELRSLREEERHEREKLMLRIENVLLKFERQLPPSKEPKKLR